MINLPAEVARIFMWRLGYGFHRFLINALRIFFDKSWFGFFLFSIKLKLNLTLLCQIDDLFNLQYLLYLMEAFLSL